MINSYILDKRIEKLKIFLHSAPSSERISDFWGDRIAGYALDASSSDWFSHAEKRVRGSEADVFGFQKQAPFPRDHLHFFYLRLSGFLNRKKYSLLGSIYNEHARALYFLWTRGLYKPYQAFLQSLNIGSSMPVARYFWYLNVLEKKQSMLFGDAPLHILEIGAGAGGFAIFFMKRFSVGRYVIIDLPEMLGHAALQFIQFTDRNIYYPDEIQGFADERGIYLLTPEQADILPDSFFDASFNFRSFGEMKMSHIKRYIHHIYRSGKKSSIFYNVNHFIIHHDRDGEVSENNPLLFPYDARDRVIQYGLDDFHHETRTILGLRKPTMTILRLAIINPSE